MSTGAHPAALARSATESLAFCVARSVARCVVVG